MYFSKAILVTIYMITRLVKGSLIRDFGKNVAEKGLQRSVVGLPSAIPDIISQDKTNESPASNNYWNGELLDIEEDVGGNHRDERWTFFRRKKVNHNRCTFIGDIGIKDQCEKFAKCTHEGSDPVVTECDGGKYFDHKKRICVKKMAAQCNSRVVCPKEGLMFHDEKNANPQAYLICEHGVPMPKLCPKRKHFDEQKQNCEQRQHH